MTSSHINPASVDFLQTVLSHLIRKNADGSSLGPILTADVGGSPIYNDDAYLRDELRFLEGMHGLSQLREARRALSHLLSSIERTQETLRSAMYPAILSRGIDRLPEEILSHILTLAGSPGWKAALYLSWISRRFRTVALATPRLWSSLPPTCIDDLSCEAMTCFLERSKNVGLSAVHMLMVHKHQWKELTADLATIHKELRITEDEIERFQWAHYLVDYDWDDDASPEFFSGWQFPSLKTLVSEAPERDADGPKLILDALADFLNSQPSLKTFKLIVGEYAYAAMGRDIINLPELRTLHLENRYAHPDLFVPCEVFRVRCCYPKSGQSHCPLSMAHMNDLGGSWMSSGWVSTFFPHGKRFGSLGNFRLEYTVENNISSQFLRDIKWFPVLNNVNICTSSAPVISGLLEHELWIDSHLVGVRFRDSHPDHRSVVREYNFREEGVSSRSFFE
ncbi:hypothetical protein ACEPAI_6417 [Sanghuangporus weigelae]